MVNNMCLKRLKKEYLAISTNPIENVTVCPRENNMLDCHFAFDGAPDSDYFGGVYWGKLIFPPEYPMKPPGIMMMTESGRFKTDCRLCFSMSDFHPESWNPMWSVRTIILGLYSFMLEDCDTYGSISSTKEEKARLAQQSLGWNCEQESFREMFPQFVDKHKLAVKTKPKTDTEVAISKPVSVRPTSNSAGTVILLLIVGAIISAVAFRFLYR